jgi:predicted lipoprotein with Yx(FWY)xxD motif
LAAGTLATSLALLPLASPAAASSKSSGHTLTVTSVRIPKIGTVLADNSGLTLYHLTSDPSGKATCTGACAKVWPPLLLPKGDHLHGPHGLKDFSTIALAHGKKQVSFHGEALYRFAGDKKKGQAGGQGVEGTWFAVLASNTIPSTTPLPAPTSTTTSSTAAPGTASTAASTKTKSTSAPKSTTPGNTSGTPAPTSPPATTPTTPPATTPPPTTPAVTSPPPTTPPPPTTTPTTAKPPSGGYGY